jgi:hypothetical protein
LQAPQEVKGRITFSKFELNQSLIENEQAIGRTLLAQGLNSFKAGPHRGVGIIGRASGD